MKHAGPAAHDRLEDLIAALRQIENLSEKSRGVFYRRGKASLHFHEDPAGLFADIRGQGDFDRFDVSSVAQRRAFLAEARRRAAVAPH